MSGDSVPASTRRFTTHELLAMLAFNRGAPEQFSRSVLRLGNYDDDSDLVRAGLSTLSVRDQLSIEGEDVSPAGTAGVVTKILTTAELWCEVTIVTRWSTTATFLVSSRHGKAALFIQPISEYSCVPLQPDLDLTAMALDVVQEAITDVQDGLEMLSTVRINTLGGEPRVANLRRNADDGWQIASSPLDDEGRLTVRDVDSAAAGYELLCGHLVVEAETEPSAPATRDADEIR